MHNASRAPIYKALYATLLVGILLSLCLGVSRTPVARAQEAGTKTSTGVVQTSPEIVTDQIIVKYKVSTKAHDLPAQANQILNLSQAAGVSLTYIRPMSGDAHVLRLPESLPLDQVKVIASNLMTLPEVEYAEPDQMMYLTPDSVEIQPAPMLLPLPKFPANNGNELQLKALNIDDPDFLKQWYLYDTWGINALAAWNITTGSSDIVVAVFDSGITGHIEFDGRTVPGYEFISEVWAANDGDGWDADPGDPGDWTNENECYDHAPNLYGMGDAQPSSWHGTHVAGIIGANAKNGQFGVGINWNSKILPVRVLGKCGNRYSSDITDGMRWAAGLDLDVVGSGVPARNNNPARVLNLSIGASSTCPVLFQDAINDVIAAGSIVVVGAGNGVDHIGVDAGNTFPANCNGVITVAATGRSGNKASYSNYGSTVEISAPGGDGADLIYSTVDIGEQGPIPRWLSGGDTWRYMGGTSQAAPMVSGVISLMLSLNPSLSPAQVLDILQRTAKSFPSDGTCNKSNCGSGIVDARAAVQYVKDHLGTGLDCGQVSYDAVILYEHIICNRDYAESTKTFSAPTNWMDIVTDFNDITSSIYVSPGWSVKVYENATNDSNGGSWRCITHSMWDLGIDYYSDGNTGQVINDTISSVQVYNNGNCLTGTLKPGDIINLQSLGNVEGPRWLDGHTNDGTVALAPQTDGMYTGTKWEVVDLGNSEIGLKSLGTIEGPRWLDGHTNDGTVTLAPQTDGGYTGTHWRAVDLGNSEINLVSLGAVEGPRYLDGRTHNGTVGLAPSTDSPYTGTRWAVVPSTPPVSPGMGYKLPWLSSEPAFHVWGDGTTHAMEQGVPRHSYDFGTYSGTTLVAMRSGSIAATRWNYPGGGHLIVIDTQDGYCSGYMHLSEILVTEGVAVLQGQTIGKSGHSDNGNIHTHIAVYTKAGSTCDVINSATKMREVPIYFDEIGREPKVGDNLKSQNGPPVVVTECPATITGWKAEYYPNRTLSGSVVACRDEANVNFDWGAGSPDPAVPSDNFSARYTRSLDLPAGEYTFHLAGDDGIRLFVDGQLLIDKWFDQGLTEYSTQIHLNSSSHTLQVDYYEANGGAIVKLWWDFTPGQDIPTIHTRSQMFWDNIYTGFVDTMNFDKWPFMFTDVREFTLTLNRTSGDLNAWVILYNSSGQELARAEGDSKVVLSGTQPAGNYYAIVQPNSGSGNYSIGLVKGLTIDPNPPSANFDVSPLSGTAPLTVTMQIVSTANITSCSWDYGDGQTGTSCASSHEHTYNAVGPYTVSLLVNGPGGSDSLTRTGYITVDPILSVNLLGAGSGTVASDPAGINCSSTCFASFDYNAAVTLTATPATGSTFTGWSGIGCSGTGPCTVTMSAARSVTANFAPTYALSVSKTGTGSGTLTSSPAGITCGATCSALFTDSTSVTLTAAAVTGSTFTGWSGSGCSGTGTCTVIMSTARSVTANFTRKPYALSLSKTGTGNGTVTSSPAGITCGATCSALFNFNTSVTLTAAATTGSTFTGWGGSGCSGTGTCKVTMSAARSVTADFTLNTHRIYLPLVVR